MKDAGEQQRGQRQGCEGRHLQGAELSGSWHPLPSLSGHQARSSPSPSIQDFMEASSSSAGMGVLTHFNQMGMEVQVPSGFTSAWKQEGQSSDTVGWDKVTSGRVVLGL